MSSIITLTPIDGEPRVQDLQLAERLGFERPRKIREIIKRYEPTVSKLGRCPTVGRRIEGGNGVTREVQEYYLNQKQAIFICMKSETEQALEVQIEIVRVFDAYLAGKLTDNSQEAPATKVQAKGRIKEIPGGLTVEQQDTIDNMTRWCSLNGGAPTLEGMQIELLCYYALLSKYNVRDLCEIPREAFIESLLFITGFTADKHTPEPIQTVERETITASQYKELTHKVWKIGSYFRHKDAGKYAAYHVLRKEFGDKDCNSVRKLPRESFNSVMERLSDMERVSEHFLNVITQAETAFFKNGLKLSDTVMAMIKEGHQAPLLLV